MESGASIVAANNKSLNLSGITGSTDPYQGIALYAEGTTFDVPNSFQFTLLNMLHGRVAYPEKRTGDASRPSGDQIPSGTGG